MAMKTEFQRQVDAAVAAIEAGNGRATVGYVDSSIAGVAMDLESKVAGVGSVADTIQRFVGDVIEAQVGCLLAICSFETIARIWLCG